MSELLVLEHTAAAGVSAFTDVLDARTNVAPWRRLDVPAGDPLPDGLDDLAGVLVMGGTMSAVAPHEHTWMPPEIALLRAAVDAEVPVFGVCLGAQLLGQALGGEVAPRSTPRIGYVPLSRTEMGRDDEVAGGWPDGAAALFVHEDEVATLPDDALPLLTGSEGTPAWRLGSAYAVQFHPEVTGTQLTSWVTGGALDDFLRRSGTDGDALVEEARRRSTFTVPLGRALLGRWIDTQVRSRLR